MQEQELIHAFLTKFRIGDDVKTELAEMSRPRYRDSVILQYYAGVYHETTGALRTAQDHYERCVSISPYFAPPYFHLAELYMRNGRQEATRQRLLHIFDKDTLDATVAPPRRRYQIMDQLRVVSLLFPLLNKGDPRTHACYHTMIRRILDDHAWQYRHYEAWKNIHIAYAGEMADTNIHRSLQLYATGLERTFHTTQEPERATLQHMDRTLLQGFCLQRDYVDTDAVPTCPVPVSALYPARPPPRPWARQTWRKVRVGYMSPDFNKNAVGLFVTPLLKHFDTERFEVYCYYNHAQEDEFTRVFRSYPNITWTNIASMTDEDAYEWMARRHQIDILFDLIGWGTKNRAGLMSMKPAPVLINYLGYPDYTHLPAMDYRLVDHRTDPDTETHASFTKHAYQGMGYRETLLRLPRCFVCYHMFDNIALPTIRSYPSEHPNEVRCAIMNKKMKWTPTTLEVWRAALTENPHLVIYLKLEEGDTADTMAKMGFPRERVRLVPFFEDLPSYLDFYNEVDLCLDTFPYNGTTTTCSSLVMGVPVLALYDPIHRHVSNVSGSILHFCGEDPFFLAPTLEEYKRRIGLFQKETREQRQERRDRFMATMDAKAFMKDLESILQSL